MGGKVGTMGALEWVAKLVASVAKLVWDGWLILSDGWLSWIVIGG
jgi:hypothetical protein